MARRERKTVPLDSRIGVLSTFAEQEPHLLEAEWRGRRWAFEQAATRRMLTDAAILELHSAMFGELLAWAGKPRTIDAGPGGRVDVPSHLVRQELRKLGDDFAAWLASTGEDPTLDELAVVLADAHHRFQWIHPFLDTNGRTGRVLDHFLLWSCFGLAGTTLRTSPILEHFPDEATEERYYQGLLEADLHRPEPLRRYYADRLRDALAPIFTVHAWDGASSTRCVAVHSRLSDALGDALQRSRAESAEVVFRVLDDRGELAATAHRGELRDARGNRIEP